MIKHTTVNLDTDLLKAAQGVLGTTQTAETIHRALQEVINRRKRERLAAYDFPDLTPAAVDEMRTNRLFCGTDDSELS